MLSGAAAALVTWRGSARSVLRLVLQLLALPWRAAAGSLGAARLVCGILLPQLQESRKHVSRLYGKRP